MKRRHESGRWLKAVAERRVRLLATLDFPSPANGFTTAHRFSQALFQATQWQRLPTETIGVAVDFLAERITTVENSFHERVRLRLRDKMSWNVTLALTPALSVRQDA